MRLASMMVMCVATCVQAGSWDYENYWQEVILEWEPVTHRVSGERVEERLSYGVFVDGEYVGATYDLHYSVFRGEPGCFTWNIVTSCEETGEQSIGDPARTCVDDNGRTTFHEM